VEWNIVQEIVQKSLNSNKAMGLDNISPRDLKLCESSVAQGLFEICMKSRADCQFPISWKKSQVAAVFKKGNRLDVNNYRPISLLSIPCKILERVVCRSFDNHLTSHSLLSDRQWGFRKGHSRRKKPWTMDLSRCIIHWYCEITGSNPVEVLTFSGFYTQLLKLRS